MRGVLRALCWLLWVLAVPAWAVDAGPGPILRLDTAHILLSDSPQIPPDTAAWQAQSLPDNWNLSRPDVGGFAWYRVVFESDVAPAQLSALYIPKLSMTGDVYLNGELIGTGGPFVEPLPRLWYQPQRYSVPGGLLVPGRNVIHVRMKAYANDTCGLSELYFGPEADVTEKWRQRHFWQITTAQLMSALTCALGLLVLLAWVLRPWHTAYGYYGASSLLWALRDINVLVVDLPVSPLIWQVMVTYSMMLIIVLMLMFVLRFENLHPRRAERVVWTFALVMPFALLAASFSSPAHYMFVARLAYYMLVLLGAYIIAILSRAVWRERTLESVMLVLASLLAFVLCAHDVFNYGDAFSFSSPYIQHFGPPIMFVAVGWNIVKRFQRAQGEAEVVMQTLEARVQEKTAELENSHARLRAVEAVSQRALERERIMQDMHDGLGSQLVSSLAMAQAGALSTQQTYELLRGCIDDLRLAIDSSQDSQDSLTLALGNLRFRMQPRLKAAGIALHWDVQHLSDKVPLRPLHQLPIMRMIQEIITNALKHSQARSLFISAANTATALTVTVRDDGVGFDVAAARQSAMGKGLNSLEKRARVLGASLQVDSSAQGTCIVFVVPLERRAVPR